MKPAFVLIVGLIFVLVILALVTLQGSVMMLAFPLLAYLFMAIWQQPEQVNLRVTREIFPDHAPEGTLITVKLALTNQGPALDEAAVIDVLPTRAKQISGISATIAHLAKNEQIELEYTITTDRGEYSTYDVLVVARDVLGLFEFPATYRTTPRLIAQPRYPKLDRIKIRPPQTHGFAGPIAARQGGSGIGFWGIREYQAGDPQRQINWKRAARTDQELFTNVFEQERVANVGLILDTRQRANIITPDGSLFEHAVRATAALAENFLDDGNRVSLMLYGSGIGTVFPGYGRIQRNRILRALARTEPGVNFALATLDRLPTRSFPAKSQIVMVSALLPEDVSAIVAMRSQGYAVIVVSPDPVSFEATSNRDSSSLAYRLAYAERELILHQIRREGVQVVNWVVSQPLQAALREVLSRQPLISHINRIGRL